MSWLRKKDPTVESKKEDPPYPLDKPNSCEYCQNTYANAYCIINKKVVYKTGIPGWRTWDRCDRYAPQKICKTCKHYSPKIGIVMDEEFEDDRASCTIGSIRELGCWEAKE